MGLKTGHTVWNEVSQVFHSHDESDILGESLHLANNIVWYVTVKAPERSKHYKLNILVPVFSYVNGATG